MARHRGQKWGARDLGMPGLATWKREALKRIIAKRGIAYVREALRTGTIKDNPRAHRGELTAALKPRITLADYAAEVVAALAYNFNAKPQIPKPAMAYVRDAWAAGWPSQDAAEDIVTGFYKRNENNPRRRNPPRDPIFVGSFTDGDGPQVSSRYADGDTAAVASPYKKGTWEVWIYGTIDPAIGDSWNLAEKNLSRGAAIQRAHELVKF